MQRKAITSREEMVRWLNSAYSMELSMVEVLEHHARDARALPHVEQRLQLHATETRQQADRLKEAIMRAGGSVSTTKGMLGDLLGRVQAISTEFFRDELVKNALTDYASEHFEIASYKSLIAGAEFLNMPDVADICRQNLREEETMALWLDGYIREVTLHHLQSNSLQAAA
jgi:ferritin-like metal-binding protein YciE